MKNKVKSLADLGSLLNSQADAEEIAWKDEHRDKTIFPCNN